MKFQLTGVVENIVSQGSHAKGPWFLYAVKETISPDKTKTWRIFCGTTLNVGSKIDFTGYISESPNKMYNNSAGKHPYQTSYSATSCELAQVEIPF